MGNINDFIVSVVIRQRVRERALFLCENLNNIYGEFPAFVDMKEPKETENARRECLWICFMKSPLDLETNCWY